MHATPIDAPEKVSYKDKTTGEDRVFFKQLIALHDTPECPDARVLLAKKLTHEFPVADAHGYKVDETFLVSAASIRPDQRGRANLGRLVLVEID